MMDARRRRRPTSATTTTTTTDDDENDNRRRRKNLVHSFCQKSWILERLRVFEKQRKFDFFQRSLPWTKKMDRYVETSGRPTTAKKSRALILPKILNFRKIASFWKTSKIWFFSKVPPLDEKGKWWTPGDGDDRRRRRPTKTTTDDDENDDRRRRKNLVHSFCQKSWISERLRVFEKPRKFDFFQRSLPWTKKGNDARRRRTTSAATDEDDDRRRRKRRSATAKKSRALILPKILNFRKIASFWKTRKFDFFQRSLPWTKKGRMNDDRRRRRRRAKTNFFQRSLPWTTGNDGRPTKKSRALILPKILNFRKIASFWKTAKIWFFSKVPPLDEKGKWWTPGDGDDRRRRRPTTTTDDDESTTRALTKNLDDDENDNRRRRKNLVHSFCQKSWILERLRVFEKHRKFDFFQRSLPWTKKGNDGRRRPTSDDGDDRRRRRKNLGTHFAKNLEF